MRIVGFVPSKLNSKRLPQKNILPLNSRPLINYTIQTLNQVELIDDSVIFASENSIEEHIEKNLRYTFLERPEYLDTDEAKVQDFTREFLLRDPADIIVLLHITSPFVRPETVTDCIEKVLSGKHDSAFLALEEYRFAWFKGKPVNYDLSKDIPRTQDLEPVVFEQTGCYVFRREVFEKTNRRIGEKPYIRTVDRFEGHDIDTREDYLFAQFLLENGLLRKV